jgi:DNA-binding response OmpR family regulator
MLQRYDSNAVYDFVAATSGQEALDKIEQDVPDLVLLDVVMPNMNGFEAYRRIRENEKTKRLPILIVTALRSESDCAAAAGAGANELIVKPIDGAYLAKRLRHHLGSPFKLQG